MKNASKSFPSSIVPPGGELVNVRNGHPKFETIHLEVFEIVFGSIVLFFILGRQFKALKHRYVAYLARAKA